MLLRFAALTASCSAAISTVSNIVPRRATTGAIIDAHDGNVVEDPSTPGLFWYFAAGYGNCTEPRGLNGCSTWCDNCGCGFFYNHSVNAFSSTDFNTWTAHGNVLPLGGPRPNSVLFSPKVLYNDRTREWVLWYNVMPPYNYAVATSPSPLGPFLTIATDTALSTQFGRLYNNSKCGDFSLFKDDDGVAYILYSSDAHAQIERLTPDFYASTWATTGDTSGVFPRGNEAPAMFKRGGIYYALISDSCCYCGQGGQVRAFQAAAPLGPYVYTGDITLGSNPFGTGQVTTSSQCVVAVCAARAARTPRAHPSCTHTHAHAPRWHRQTNVFRVGDQFIWQGDRWQSAPSPTRFKGEDFTAWFVLGFGADGAVANITWQDSIQITL